MNIKRFDELFLNRAQESWETISPEEFLSYLKTKVETAITWEEIETKLKEKRPLKIKLGIDPTGSDIHLGHIVPIMLLRQFMKAGHHIDLIIGDFTAQIGDPSGRDSARTPLTLEMIEKNLATYVDQIGRFIDTSKITVNRNSKWLSDMTLPQIFPLLESINLSEAMQREDFRNRTKNGQGVSLAEATYALLMGIDSVNLKTDIELGGIDQLLNFQQCRSVMRSLGMTQEAVVTTPILEGTAGDGKKMSKSFGNYIAVTASAEDKFGKIMSIPDSLALNYFKSFADVNEKEVEALDSFIKESPLEAKKQLATFIVALETGSLKDGETQRENFERKFSKKEISENDTKIITCNKDAVLFEVLFSSGDFASKTELRRLFEQNAVRLVSDESVLMGDMRVGSLSGLIRVGKLKLYSLNLS